MNSLFLVLTGHSDQCCPVCYLKKRTNLLRIDNFSDILVIESEIDLRILLHIDISNEIPDIDLVVCCSRIGGRPPQRS